MIKYREQSRALFMTKSYARSLLTMWRRKSECMYDHLKERSSPSTQLNKWIWAYKRVFMLLKGHEFLGLWSMWCFEYWMLSNFYMELFILWLHIGFCPSVFMSYYSIFLQVHTCYIHCHVFSIIIFSWDITYHDLKSQCGNPIMIRSLKL